MRALPLLLALVACGGPVEETLVDELRIVASVPDAPEVGPGDPLTVRPWVVDPAGTGVDVLVWGCTPAGPPGTPCLEAASPDPGFVAVARDLQPGDTLELTVPTSFVGIFIQGVDRVPSQLWTLACAPGVCPILDEAEEALVAGGPAADAVVRDLADPTALLQDLPLVDVAAASRPLGVTRLPAEARGRHPVVEGPTDLGPVAPGDSLAVPLTISHAAPTTAYGYATAGGFDTAAQPVVEGGVSLTWIAPEEGAGGPVDLYAVVQDGRGGEAVWQGRTEVTVP